MDIQFAQPVIYIFLLSLILIGVYNTPLINPGNENEDTDHNIEDTRHVEAPPEPVVQQGETITGDDSNGTHASPSRSNDSPSSSRSNSGTLRKESSSQSSDTNVEGDDRSPQEQESSSKSRRGTTEGKDGLLPQEKEKGGQNKPKDPSSESEAGEEGDESKPQPIANESDVPNHNNHLESRDNSVSVQAEAGQPSNNGAKWVAQSVEKKRLKEEAKKQKERLEEEAKKQKAKQMKKTWRGNSDDDPSS